LIPEARRGSSCRLAQNRCYHEGLRVRCVQLAVARLSARQQKPAAREQPLIERLFDCTEKEPFGSFFVWLFCLSLATLLRRGRPPATKGELTNGPRGLGRSGR